MNTTSNLKLFFFVVEWNSVHCLSHWSHTSFSHRKKNALKEAILKTFFPKHTIQTAPFCFILKKIVILVITDVENSWNLKALNSKKSKTVLSCLANLLEYTTFFSQDSPATEMFYSIDKCSFSWCFYIEKYVLVCIYSQTSK